MTNCPDCRRVLEPATLNAKHQWCSVCAMEFDETGNKCESHLAPPPAVAPAAEEIPGVTAPIRSISANVDDKSKAPRFRVTIGAVGFVAHGRAELDIGGQKITIEAL